MTLEEFAVKLYLPYLVDIKSISPSTVGSYKSMFDNHIFPNLGFKIISEITSKDIERFILSVKTSAKYKKNIVLLLQGMFNYAIDQEYLTVNPVKRHHKPVVHREEKPCWTAEQVCSILDALPEEYKPIFQIAALTGFRVGEILALRWSNVDLGRRQITVSASLWRGHLKSPKTDASKRTRPFGDELAKILYRLSKTPHDPNDFLFVKNGKPLCPDVLRRDILYPTLASLGLPRPKRAVGFHAFRHAFGSLVLSASGNLKLVQKLLGHASIQTTANIYTHIYSKDEQRAVDDVETLVTFGKSSPAEATA